MMKYWIRAYFCCGAVDSGHILTEDGDCLLTEAGEFLMTE